MILFFNVYITNQLPGGHGLSYSDRENAKSSDRLDIFKYNLASLSKIYKWKKVIINCKLDDFFMNRQEELHDFIKSEFEINNLHLRSYRNETQKQWQDDYKLLDDNLIWFSCNHDHIFIDTNLDYFHSVIDDFKDRDDYFSIRVSHWQQCLACGTQFAPMATYNNMIHDKYYSYNINHEDSIQIISKKTYYHWWLEFNLPELNWGRPDYFTNYIKSFAPIKDGHWHVPYREWCRHFDAYQHHIPKYDNRQVPVLEIPDGFFENNIKIYYGPNYKKGYTNIDPFSNKIRITDDTLCDYNYDLSSIPLFWLPRIKEFIDEYPNEEMSAKNVYINRIIFGLNDLGNLILNKVRENY
jgi:hypothetical protein